MSKIWNYLKNKPRIMIAVVLAILLAVFIGWRLFGSGNKNNATVATVSKGTISQVVSITGKTASQSSVDMAFQIGGQVSDTRVKVGDRVEAGQTLVVLNQGELYAQVLQSKAALELQQSKLDDLKRGAKPEDLQVSQSQAQAAQVSLDNAREGLINSIQDAYTKSDDAVRSHADKFFIDQDTSSPQLKIYFNDAGSVVTFDMGVDYTLKTNVTNQRAQLSKVFSGWKSLSSSLAGLSPDDLYNAAIKSEDYVNKVKTMIDTLATAINSISTPDYNFQTIVGGYKTEVSNTRYGMESVVSSLSASEQQYKSALANFNTAQKQYQSLKAGPTADQIAAQQAAVDQTNAGLSMSQAQLNKTVLTAPISGVVTRQDGKLGQIVSPGIIMVSIINDSDLEIDANVSEIDIGKISLNNPVNITLDAFPGETFTGKVFYMDPAETIVDGVVNYKIKVAFDKKDTRFKSGLTANLDIVSQTKQNVLTVPQYAIIENDQGTFVNKIVNGKIVETKIVTGLKDQNGNVEVVSGLKEGDQVQNVGIKTSS